MTPEKIIQNAILREFGTRSDMRIWRANCGVAMFQGRLVQFGIPGQADLTGILPGGVRLEIECKAPGGRQSAEQRNYQRMTERFGGVYVLAFDVAGVWAAVGKYLNGRKGAAGE